MLTFLWVSPHPIPLSLPCFETHMEINMVVSEGLLFSLLVIPLIILSLK